MPLTIVACVKQVPDSWAEKRLLDIDSTLDRESADPVLNELDEYAVEEALRIVETQGGEVTILSVGPDAAADSVRKAISMGANSGILVSDAAIHGSDALATSLVLAKALEGRGFDLIMFGCESTDARMSVVPAMVAARLGLPQMTFAAKVEVASGSVTINRVTDTGYDEVSASLPAVVSVVEKINEPRYPSFKGIMAAKKKPIEKKSLGDIGVSASELSAWSEVVDSQARPPREKGVKLEDSGEGGSKLADYLLEKRLV